MHLYTLQGYHTTSRDTDKTWSQSEGYSTMRGTATSRIHAAAKKLKGIDLLLVPGANQGDLVHTHYMQLPELLICIDSACVEPT